MCLYVLYIKYTALACRQVCGTYTYIVCANSVFCLRADEEHSKYANTHTHTHTHTCIYIHTYIHTYIHIYIHTCYIHTYTHTHTHTYIQQRMTRPLPVPTRLSPQTRCSSIKSFLSRTRSLLTLLGFFWYYLAAAGEVEAGEGRAALGESLFRV